MGGLGRTLVVLGLALVALGALLLLAERFPGLRIGRLPGDVSVERGNLRLYFPIGTSIVISVVLTVLFWLLGRRG
jgi:hypothetical protein